MMVFSPVALSCSVSAVSPVAERATVLVCFRRLLRPADTKAAGRSSCRLAAREAVGESETTRLAAALEARGPRECAARGVRKAEDVAQDDAMT